MTDALYALRGGMGIGHVTPRDWYNLSDRIRKVETIVEKIRYAYDPDLIRCTMYELFDLFDSDTGDLK